MTENQSHQTQDHNGTNSRQSSTKTSLLNSPNLCEAQIIFILGSFSLMFVDGFIKIYHKHDYPRLSGKKGKVCDFLFFPKSAESREISILVKKI